MDEKIQKKFNNELFFELIRKYYSQILFVPLILGGLNQIFCLASISPDCLRFFSATQSIADGLYQLTIIIYMLFSGYAIFWILSLFIIDNKVKSEGKDKDANSQSNKSKLSEIGFLMITVVLIIGFSYLFKESSRNLFLLSPIISILFFLGSITLFPLIESKSNKYSINSILYLVFILSMIYGQYTLNVSINSTTIENIKIVQLKYQYIYPDGKSEVLYYNDNFIFIKYLDAGLEKITIEKLDQIFEETPLEKLKQNTSHNNLKVN